MTEQFANNASTTLNGALNNSSTSVAVTNGAPFSQSGTFRVIVDSEIMIVNSIAGNTLSVSRGQEGTTAVSHLSGAVITQIVTAGALTQMRTDITQVGVLHAGSGNPNTFPSFVQGLNVGNNASSGSLVNPTTTNSVTAGNLLVVFLQCENGGTTSTTPTDSLGTTYSSVIGINGTLGTNNTQVFGTVYAGIAPSSGICTVHATQGTSWNRTSVAEYKNATTTVDSTATNTGTNNTVSVSPLVANSLVLGIVGDFVSNPGTFTTSTSSTALNMAVNFQGTGGDSTFYESGIAPTGGSFTVAYSPAAAGNIFFGIVFHPATVSATVGNDGDFYIDTTNKVLYGPRLNGVYTKIGTLT